MSFNTRNRLARLAVAGLAVLSGSAMINPSAAYASTSDIHTNPLIVNGQTWRSVPYVVSGGTTFFGIWYLQQLLSQYGIQNTWDGRNLKIGELPTVNSSAQTLVNGNPVTGGATLTFGDQNYVNLSAVARSLSGFSQYVSGSQTLQVELPSTTTGADAVTIRQKQSAQTHLAVSPTTDHQVQTSAHFTAGATQGSGVLYENGKLWRKVPIVHRSGTTFFGVWYVQQWFRAHGVQSQWNGKSLTLVNFPMIHANGNVQSSRTSQHVPLIALNGDWYGPTSALQTIGLTGQVDSSTHTISVQSNALQTGNLTGTLVDAQGIALSGQVAVVDGSGMITEGTLDSQGRFAVCMASGSGTLIGVNVPNEGWIGQSLPVQGTGQTYSPALTQATTTIQGKLDFQGSPYMVTQVSIRNVITHAHYYAAVNADGTFSLTVPVGGYETFALVTGQAPIFLVQPFIATVGSTTLDVTVPALPSGNQVVTAHACVVAGDSDVTAAELQSVSTMFEHVYTGDVRDTGIQPTGQATITLYGSTSSYQQHFLNEGYSSTEAQQIADNAVATDEGPGIISVLMPAFNSVDGFNILAHEFTHALIANVSTQIPSWANEGVAWIEGIRGETNGSPDTTLQQGEQWDQWIDIVAHQQQGDLYPLGDADPLSGDYNVESQDYYAVQQLVSEFGQTKFMRYVRAIDTDANAFQDTFGESFDTFSAQVTTALKAQAAQTDSGFTVRIRVLPGGPQQLYIINPTGDRQIVSGLKVGQVYAITCKNDGTIQVPSSLQVSAGPNFTVSDDGDWFIGSGGDSAATGFAQDRQEFDIAHQFAVPYLVQAILYDNQDNVVHAYPATEIPNGLQIVDVTGNDM